MHISHSCVSISRSPCVKCQIIVTCHATYSYSSISGDLRYDLIPYLRQCWEPLVPFSCLSKHKINTYTRRRHIIDPAKLDKPTMDTLLGQIIKNYHMSREDAQDILQDVMLKLVVWYSNNAETDKFKGGTIRMAIPFIRAAIRNRIIDGRMQWYTEGRQMYRLMLEEMKVAVQEGHSHSLSTPMVDRLSWSMDREEGTDSIPLDFDADLVRWMGGLTDVMTTAVIGRHILEMTRGELVSEYPEFFASDEDVSAATKKGLKYLRQRATQEGAYDTTR